MIEKNKKQWLLVGIVLAMLIWGVSWPSAKILSQYGKPINIAFIRFVFSFLGVLVILKTIRVPLTISKKGTAPLLIASILMAFYSLLFFSGIKNGMPGAGGVLVTTTTPMVTFLLGAWLSKKQLVRREIIGICLGVLAGTFLLQLWSNYLQVFERGNVYFLGSTIVWAFISRYTAASHQYGSALAFSLWMYLLCIVWLAFFVDFIEIKEMLTQGDGMFWFNILFNAVINTGIATTIYFFTTSQLGAEKTSSFIYIVPFAASISSLIIVHEVLHWNTIVGGLLGILAVWIINKKVESPIKTNIS